MAGNQNSGGYRPTAPQNNPANISATGGNGQSGQARPEYTGFAYGQNQALQQQAGGATMAKAPSPTGVALPVASVLPQVTPIGAPTERPDEPVTSGIAMGAGPGPEALTLPGVGDSNEDKQRLLSYLPALEVAAQNPNASQAFRNYVRVLRSNL